MNKTGIEYLDYTWNPIAMRCTPISEACDNCWHLRTCDRLKENPKIAMSIREAYAGDRPPVFIYDRLFRPSKLKKPAIIGVHFMGDILHEDIEPLWFALIMREINLNPQHTFLILTKRPERMIDDHLHNTMIIPFFDKPAPNLWFGTTVELQKHDHRIATLLDIPASVHFVSLEPMLSQINLDNGYTSFLTCNGKKYDENCCGSHHVFGHHYRGIDWVICGAETGPKRRAMDLSWARSVRDQCTAAGVPFFFKRDSQGNRELDGKLWGEFPK